MMYRIWGLEVKMIPPEALEFLLLIHNETRWKTPSFNRKTILVWFLSGYPNYSTFVHWLRIKRSCTDEALKESQTVMAMGMTLCSHGKKTKEHIPSKHSFFCIKRPRTDSCKSIQPIIRDTPFPFQFKHFSTLFPLISNELVDIL